MWLVFWQFLRRNPNSSLAGVGAIAAVFVPGHTAQIAAIAAGVGLILAGDAK
jgi:hypothetical protein